MKNFVKGSQGRGWCAAKAVAITLALICGLALAAAMMACAYGLWLGLLT